MDTLLESYYGPELYDIYQQRYDPTERWLREAYREQMEEYRRGLEGEREEERYEEEGVFRDFERNFGEDWGWAREEGDWVWDGRDENWSDEDVLLGYLISKEEERGGVGREELEDIFSVISRSNNYPGGYEQYNNSYFGGQGYEYHYGDVNNIN